MPRLRAARAPTARGYADEGAYAVSAAAQRSVREIARDHHLDAVTAWPIDALGVHCVVFQKPANQPLDAVLAELRADARVAGGAAAADLQHA